MPKKKKQGQNSRGSRHNSSNGKYVEAAPGRNFGMARHPSDVNVPAPADPLTYSSTGFLPTAMAPAPAGLSRADFVIGMKVVRGPAWCGGRMMYADQDGGAGSIGTVVELPAQLAAKPEHRH
jgi:hypothetical protein